MKIQNLLRGLVLLTATLSVNSSVAQEKLFQAALAKGRQPGAFYVARNDKGKGISPEKMKQYARERNYLIGEYTTQTVDKFGDKSTAVSTFEFLPDNLYPEYVYVHTKHSNAPRYDQLSQLPKGSCYVYSGSKFTRMDNVSWSGKVEDGMLSGTGYGFVSQMIAPTNGTYYYIEGGFQNGLPQGECMLRVVSISTDASFIKNPQETSSQVVNVGVLQDNMATFRVGKDNKIGFVQSNGVITLQPTYRDGDVLGHFKNGLIAVKNDKKESVYVDKSGKFVDYTESQKKIFADAKAHEDSIKAAELQAKLLAEQKAAEEKRLAQEKRLAYLQKIKPLQDKNKWQRGDRLCLEFGREGRFITGTLEEWNGDRSKCKIKIVTSPNGNMTYNGDLLTKNNTIWIPTAGEGWHKALPEEIEAANKQDDSLYEQTRSKLTLCPDCGGHGYIGSGYYTRECRRCDRTGFIVTTETIRTM